VLRPCDRRRVGHEPEPGRGEQIDVGRRGAAGDHQGPKHLRGAAEETMGRTRGE
jgi:hypothetical protein